MGNCIATPYEPDIHRVAASIIATRSMTAEKAMEMANTKHYRRHIRTFTPANCAELLRGVYTKYLGLSQDGVRLGERPLFQ